MVAKRNPIWVIACLVALAFVAAGCGEDQALSPGLSSLSPAGKPADGIGAIAAIQERHTPGLLKIDGVVGTAIGEGAGPGGLAILVLTDRESVAGVPGQVDGVPVIPRVVGRIVALAKGGKPGGGSSIDRTARFARPVPIGVSTGHPAVTAGTIGCRVKDAAGNVYALSNNHVYANANNALLGDGVIQPGTYDDGSSPGDVIGTLYDFEPILFGGSNSIDAAVALSSTALLGNATPSDGYGTPRSQPVDAFINMKVKKYGRTTGQTSGQIWLLNATVNVSYDGADPVDSVATFSGQIIITPGSFSAGGDSGSLIVGEKQGRNTTNDRSPVGLLFAGSSSITVANPIGDVLDRFAVTIDGP